MIIKQCKLWDDESDSLYYDMYLQDNSPEIDSSRKHPAMIVCGGGAYMGISDREKEPVALEFLRKGYQVFVLTYTTAAVSANAAWPVPVYDLAQMVLTIRQHAEEWNINPNKIAAIGFSAGAHLVACLSTQWDEGYLAKKLETESSFLKLNAAILCYPLTNYIYQQKALELDPQKNESPASMPQKKTEINAFVNIIGVGSDTTEEQLKAASPYYHITDKTCPTFLWATATDELVYPGQSLLYAEKLIHFGVPVEMHLFDHGVHGMSLATEQSGSGQYVDESVSRWLDMTFSFLEKHLMLSQNF